MKYVLEAALFQLVIENMKFRAESKLHKTYFPFFNPLTLLDILFQVSVCVCVCLFIFLQQLIKFRHLTNYFIFSSLEQYAILPSL